MAPGVWFIFTIYCSRTCLCFTAGLVRDIARLWIVFLVWEIQLIKKSASIRRCERVIFANAARPGRQGRVYSVTDWIQRLHVYTLRDYGVDPADPFRLHGSFHVTSYIYSLVYLLHVPHTHKRRRPFCPHAEFRGFFGENVHFFDIEISSLNSFRSVGNFS